MMVGEAGGSTKHAGLDTQALQTEQRYKDTTTEKIPCSNKKIRAEVTTTSPASISKKYDLIFTTVKLS